MEEKIRIAPGTAMPPGAAVLPDGVNFSVFSQNAERMQLLLFHSHSDVKPYAVITLDKLVNRTAFYWHTFVYGAGAGTYYAFRAAGPDEAAAGHRFDFEKILIDPYSRAVSMKRWDRESAIGRGDNLFKSMRSVVVDDDGYDWNGDRRPGLSRSELVLYEAHPAGFTRSPGSGAANPGTFGAFAEKAGYLKKLGVNAVVMLPVMQFDDKTPLRYAPGGSPLTNYWGYPSAAFFAPHSSYTAFAEEHLRPDEFRDMVKAMHASGIEVIIDISMSHSDEGDEHGPLYGFKGLDNSVYYRLKKEEPSRYDNPIACGNALNSSHPAVRRMIIDCLEFWSEKMRVDGFRFDESSVFMKDEKNENYRYSPVFWDINFSAKLFHNKFFIKNHDIASGDSIHNFPDDRWSFFNADFKNDIRKFVKGESGLTSKVASRIAGSADLFEKAGYGPCSVINFITSHEGFTLNDLVSYNQKHNYENGEENHDGPAVNYSWNCSIEGPSDAEGVESLRERQIKNLAAILFMSQGVPLVLYGDEVRRTQNGNNNAYCQDNPSSWFDWGLLEKNRTLFRFFNKLIEFRKKHETLRRSEYFKGAVNARGLKDISWHGCELDRPGFEDTASRALAFTIGAPGDCCDIHVVMNMYWEPLEFQMPLVIGRSWHRIIDTFQPSPLDFIDEGSSEEIKTQAVTVNGRSVSVFISK